MLVLTSCQTTKQRVINKVFTDVNFPEWPEPLVTDLSYPIHRDADGNDLIKYKGDYVIVPLSVWNQYFISEEEVVMTLSYFIMITDFKIDNEAAIERLRIYNKEETDE